MEPLNPHRKGDMMTKIEWANETWNPITGCTPISEGCTNCYAEKMAKRLAGRYGYPKDDSFKVTYHRDRLELPFKWEKPRRIFVCSMGDLFHKDVKVSQLNEVFNRISVSWERMCGHKFLILTKRPKRMKKYIEEHRNYETAVCYYENSNVWLGVTAENQKRADERIPILVEIPAAVRFVSFEPMLGPIETNRSWGYCPVHDFESGFCAGCKDTKYPGWFIVGAETGPKARPMKLEWAIDLKNQCKQAGVPFFFKKASKGDIVPDELKIREYPK